MRSGSTFLGEMFNNHDDAFYVFEPLHPLSKLGLSKSSLEDRFEILTDNLDKQLLGKSKSEGKAPICVQKVK